MIGCVTIVKMEELIGYQTPPYNQISVPTGSPEVGLELLPPPLDFDSSVFLWPDATIETNTVQVLNSLDSENLQLKKPLFVLLKETPEDLIAELSDINIWGYGKTEAAAIANLCLDLEDLYFCLKEERDNLGREMWRQWQFLQDFVEEKR